MQDTMRLRGTEGTRQEIGSAVESISTGFLRLDLFSQRSYFSSSKFWRQSAFAIVEVSNLN